MTYKAMVNNLIAGGIRSKTCGGQLRGVGALDGLRQHPNHGPVHGKVGVNNEAGEYIESIPVSQYSQPIDSFTSIGRDHGRERPGSSATLDYLGIPIGTWNGLDSRAIQWRTDRLREGGQHQQHGGGHERDPADSGEPVGLQGVGEDLQRGREVVRNLYVYSSNPGPPIRTS